MCTRHLQNPGNAKINRTQFILSRTVHPGWPGVTDTFTMTIMKHSKSCVHCLKHCHGIPEKETFFFFIVAFVFQFPCSLCIYHYLTTTKKEISRVINLKVIASETVSWQFCKVGPVKTDPTLWIIWYWVLFRDSKTKLKAMQPIMWREENFYLK